ncbi:dihydropteroate synthase [Candidatus Deianiraea vastatrix]|uniref:dihydropteroate synthase n=1 Tax=Candidatus Deianiraea vastatrix TaxID=2163644 RepID=A0A5B8XFX1_9RICK|nr:dihydropteroate synthase [Candidatus Deianiraea vastatrix]QED23244.1 Dihydropteroate synthase [Candidatus Deianiraea vastatrix]
MKIFAILNITKNSFSQDGLVEIDKIEERILNFKSKNVYGIDIGFHATNPSTSLVDEDVEFNNSSEILPQIMHILKGINLSIDTFYPSVARFACELGFSYINDVNFCRNEEMLGILEEFINVKYILTHSLSIPVKRDECLSFDRNIIEQLLDLFNDKLKIICKKIEKSRVVIDPGIGFGKNVDQNWEILRNFEKFKSLGCKLYLAHSRKRFLSEISDEIKDRDIATKTISKMLENIADYARIHDV